MPPVLVIALNDAIADGRDVSWIWDVDFEPLLPHVGHVVATGERAAELGLRLLYGGLSEDRLEVIPGLEQALDRGLGLIEAGDELVILPTYTAMLSLRGVLTERGYRSPVLGRHDVTIRVGHLYPEYLNIYADRGNIAVLTRRAALRGHELDVQPIGLGEAAAARGARSALHRRRPGSRAGTDRARPGRESARRSATPWPRARHCSPSVADTSSSGGDTAVAMARSCRARASSVTRPLRVRRG